MYVSVICAEHAYGFIHNTYIYICKIVYVQCTSCSRFKITNGSNGNSILYLSPYYML